MSPLVSVIVPTKNRPDLLLNALLSIEKQTYENIEIILINDGGESVERSAKDQIKKKKLIIIDHPKSLGPAASRTAGLNKAGGKFVTYLDDDDIFYSDHVQRVAQALTVKDAPQVVYTDVDHEVLKKSGADNNNWEQVRISTGDKVEFEYDKLLVANFIPLCCLGHTLKLAKKTGGFNSSLTSLEDWEFILRLTPNTKARRIPHTTAVYRHYLGEKHVNAISPAAIELTKKIYQIHPVNPSGPLPQKRKQHIVALANGIRIDRRGALVPPFKDRFKEISSALTRGDIKQAQAILSKILEELPEDGELLMMLAKINRATGDNKSAESLIKQARQKDPHLF